MGDPNKVMFSHLTALNYKVFLFFRERNRAVKTIPMTSKIHNGTFILYDRKPIFYLTSAGIWVPTGLRVCGEKPHHPMVGSNYLQTYRTTAIDRAKR